MGVVWWWAGDAGQMQARPRDKQPPAPLPLAAFWQAELLIEATGNGWSRRNMKAAHRGHHD